MRKLISIITVCVMIVSMFSGCSVLQKLGFGGDKNDELHPVSSIVMGEEEAKLLSDKVPIHLYFATEDNTKLKLEVRYIPAAEAKKSVNNLASMIVKELIKGPESPSLKPTIPTGTLLIAPVSIDAAAATATVNLSKEFVDKQQNKADAAKLTLYSITNSLTELKEIQKVKFLINGKTQKDYKGSFQFDAPFPREAKLISKAVPMSNSDVPTNAKQGTVDKGKAVPTSQPQTTAKPTATPTPKATAKPGDGKATGGAPADQSNNIADEDAEATYLEILE